MRQGKSALVFSEVSFDNLGFYGLLCGVKRVPSLNGVSDAFQGLTVALRRECFGWLFGSSSSAPQLAFPAMIVLQTVTVLWRAYMAFLTPGQPFLHTWPIFLQSALTERADCSMVLFFRFSLPLLSPGFDYDITDGGWELFQPCWHLTWVSPKSG